MSWLFSWATIPLPLQRFKLRVRLTLTLLIQDLEKSCHIHVHMSLCPYSLHLTDIFKASPTLFYASQCKNKTNNSKIKWNTWNGSANLSVTEIMMGFGLFMKRCWHHISVWVVAKQLHWAEDISAFHTALPAKESGAQAEIGGDRTRTDDLKWPRMFHTV